MTIDLELREILDEVLDNAINKKHLKSQYDSWSLINENNGLKSFKDFVIGNLNGHVYCSYASYHGKQVSMINEEEQELLNKLIIRRLYGLEPAISSFCENNEI
jgi:hypothetical protein